MTIQNTTLRKAGPSQGNGVTTVFPFTFKVFTATDILVTYLDALDVESVLVLSTNYTVSLNADQNTSPGGSVTLLVAPAAGTYITLTSQVPNTQTLALTNSGGFYPESINNALDRTVIEIQQLAEQASRSITIPKSSTASSLLPTPAANNVLVWNATATALINLPATTGTSLVNLAASTGSALVGTTNGGTGAVARTVASKLNDTVSVKDFGAVGDGVTDDASAIQASITYAVANGKSIFFPDGNYKVNTGLILYPGCGVQTAGNASITAGAAITILTLSSGNYAQTPLNLPALYNGTNGLNLYGANLAVIYVPSIAGCGDGITLTVDNTYKSCADNTITFGALSSCSAAGIKFSYLATATSGTLMQGNAFYGNFITAVKYGIHFYDVTNGSLTALPWDDTYFEITAIDTYIPTSIGIYGQPSLPPGRCIFNIPGFFGGFDTAAIKGSANNNTFKLAFSTITYAQMQLTGVGNRIINVGAGQQGIRGVSTPVAMTTASGTIASYNGGITPYANRFYSSLTIGTALTSVAITGTAGQFSCAAASLAVGQPITITGTFGGTGSISGYAGGTYYIITTNGTTTFTLAPTFNGSAITTTAGTPTGLTYNAGLGPLQTKAFAFYHSFMQAYGCRVYVEPLFFNAPMVIMGAFENSTPGAGVGFLAADAFMGEVDVLAVGPVLAGTYKLFICVHDAPQ